MAGFESLDKPSDRYKWLDGDLSRLFIRVHQKTYSFYLWPKSREPTGGYLW